MFFPPMSAAIFGGDEGYISVYKMVEPNVRPGVCSAIVGVLFRNVPALQYIDYWPSGLDTLVIPYWDICTLVPIILYTHWFSIPFCRFCSHVFFSHVCAHFWWWCRRNKKWKRWWKIWWFVGPTCPPPPQNQCWKKLKNIETRFATYPLIGTIAARALPPCTVQHHKWQESPADTQLEPAAWPLTWTNPRLEAKWPLRTAVIYRVYKMLVSRFCTCFTKMVPGT